VNSDFIIGKNIDGISGATISVNSVTRGINRSAIIVEYLLTKTDAGSY
jgi:Na+-translocating ferredoxin:NAD+ oxidoreductase RnfG subunit